MATGIMVTDGGPHSAEDWAVKTSEMIFIPSPTMVGDRSLTALRLQMAIAELLVPHFAGAQSREKAQLAANADEAKAQDNDSHIAEATSEAEQAIAEVQSAAKGTPWEEHWNNPEVVKAASLVVASNFMTVKDIERQWHKT